MDNYTKILDDCPNECKIEDQTDMCCTTIKMYDKNTDTSFKQLQCLDKAVSDLSSGIWIDEFYYEYEC